MKLLHVKKILHHLLPIFLEPLLVLIEYVPFGDLLGYLRKSRGLNDTYYEDPDIKPQTNLRSQQLMKFAWQIADGMSYLSSKSVSLRSLELFGTLNQIEMVLNVFLFRNNPATSNIYITRNWGISYLSSIRVSNSRKMPLHLLTIGRDTCLMGRQIWIVIMIAIFTMTMIIVMMTMTIIMIFTIMINIIILLSWGK